MPYANCCVRLCVSSTRRTPDLEFYRLPEEGDERRGEWLRLIRNDALTREPASHLTRICGLHFQLRRGDVNPSVFPWTNDWPSVIRQYNKGLSENGEPLPILTPETTGVDVPRTGTCSADEGQRNMNNKGKKRLRIWVDESEGEEEAIGKGEEESSSGSYMVTPEKLGPTSERRVAEGITGTVVPTQRSGEVVSMVMTPGGPKMSVHEKAFFSPYHSSQLLNKLADLWRMGKMCDATVCIGYTIRIKAHKLVLSAMSSVIMNMAAKTEGAILELQLPGDLNVESVQKFITFLYEGVLYLSPSTVHDVQRLAAIFKVSSVQGYCETFLQSSHMAKSQPLEPQPPPTVPAASSPSPALSVPFQMVAPLNTSIPKPSSGTASPVLGTPSFQPVRLSPKLTSLSADSGIWSKRPVLRQQATVHGDEDLPQFPKYPKDSMLPSKRVQELKGLWKKGSYETSDDRSSPGLVGSDQILGSPLTTEGGSFQSTDSPGGSFDHPDLTQVKTEPEDSATESGDENSALLPGTVMFRVDGGEGMDPPDAPGTTRGRPRAVGSEQTLGNSDPALLTQQVRSAMPQTGVLFENLPIPDGFLSESNPEQQRRYMASLLERTQTSAIPERDRMYRCLFCPSSFVKAKSCVVHVIETHQVQAKDVLKYVSIERKGAKTKPKCPLCDYKVTKNQDHLHYHKYFQHGIPLPEGFQLYRCEICGKESSSKYNWRTHMDTCHFQGNTCEMCEQQFGSREELADHYRSIHISARRASPPKKRLRRLTKNVSAPADTSQSRLYVYKCPDCSFDSSLRDDIVTHMTTVHGRDMEIPELQRADCGTSHDKDQLLRTQSDDRAERLDRGKSEDMDDGKEGAEGGGEGGTEETGSMSAHSEYDCESPDSSMAHTKEIE